jgi:hypothetical protein
MSASADQITTNANLITPEFNNTMEDNSGIADTQLWTIHPFIISPKPWRSVLERLKD